VSDLLALASGGAGRPWEATPASEGDDATEAPATEPGPDDAGAVARLRRWATATNIAEELDDQKRGALAQRVLQDWKIDDDSRADWKDKYRQWMKLATQVSDPKTYPWPGASQVLYPLLTVAAIQFSARAYPAIVRGQEVVKGRVEGDDSGSATAPGQVVPSGWPGAPPQGGPGQSAPPIAPMQAPAAGGPGAPAPPGMPPQQDAAPAGTLRTRAERIGHHMSYQLLHEMDDWEEETDRLLLTLSIVGSMFRKTYYDPAKRKNVSHIVDGLRLCVNYKAPTFKGAARVTEEIDLYPWEIEERIRGGVFLDVDYGANHDMTMDEDAPTTFLEQHRRYDLDGDGYAEPYIVTVSRDGGVLARIVAGYDQETVFLDPTEDKVARVDPVPYYTKYPFVPNPESAVYDLGFGALLYPINDAINSSLNQMFDAGHLANAGGGFIGGGMSMNTGTVNFAIGEYKVVNTPGNILRDNLVPIPFPGPSAVLFNLLQFLVEAGKEIASIKDILSGAMPGANVPGILGLAVIQQGLKVFSAVFKRVHRSLAAEYTKLFRLNRLYLADEAGYSVGRKYFHVTRADYEHGHGVEPVSDPEVVTDIQQMARANFLLQFSNDPFCNGLEIRRRAFEAAAIPEVDKVLLPQPQPNPEILEKVANFHQKVQHEAAELDIRRGRDKAAEVRDLAQSILYLAQARKADSDVDGTWIDRQLDNLKGQLDALTGGQSSGIGPAATPGPGPVGGGLPGMAPPPGVAGVPPVSAGLPG
jgi:chaperonin GroES